MFNQSRSGVFFSRPCLLVICCWLAAISINYGNRKLYPPEIEEELFFIPEKTVVEFLSLDHRGLAADLMLIQVVLHSGSLGWKPNRFHFNNEWGYQMIDLLTEIDPQYYNAYLFSAMGLLHNHDDVYRSNKILKKGMTVFPESWELPFWIGFNAYLYLEDDAMASKYLWHAAHKPDAPVSFLSILLSAITKGGNLKQGIWVLESMIKHEPNPNIKLVYQKRIVRLQNFIDLQYAAEQYRLHFNKYPENLQQLVDADIILQIPKDPMARLYRWNTKTQRVECQEHRGVPFQ